MKQFEYKIVRYDVNELDHNFHLKLNELGVDGWELVGFYITSQMIYIFKKEII